MKSILLSIVIAILIIFGAIFYAQKTVAQPEDEISGNNVTTDGSLQFIEIRARNGFEPRVSYANAGTPTFLRVITNGTFDCSSTIRIPALGISQDLPPTGTTDIGLGVVHAGKIQGMCGAGLYPFEIDFK
jgi:plastocyanin domain-containing protein